MQVDLYEGIIRGLLDSVLDGYNVMVFVYGVMGCGKIYIIMGMFQLLGIIFLIMQELFEKIQDCSDEKYIEIIFFYFEIYNEMICDLLVLGGSK